MILPGENTQNISESNLFSLINVWKYQNIGILLYAIAYGIDFIRSFPSSSILVRIDTPLNLIIGTIIFNADLFVFPSLMAGLKIIEINQQEGREGNKFLKVLFSPIMIVTGFWFLSSIIWRSMINLSPLYDEIVLPFYLMLISPVLFTVALGLFWRKYQIISKEDDGIWTGKFRLILRYYFLP